MPFIYTNTVKLLIEAGAIRTSHSIRPPGLY